MNILEGVFVHANALRLCEAPYYRSVSSFPPIKQARQDVNRYLSIYRCSA